jgi:hypothetical protein
LIQAALPTGQRSLERLAYSYVALLEYETSLAYELLAAKCGNIEARLFLISLDEDTKKHANIKEAASQAFGQVYPPPMARCEVYREMR